MIELINKLYDSGELRQLVNGGFVSIDVHTQRKVYLTVEHLVSNGMNKTQAITEVSQAFNVSERTAYRMLKKMK